MYIKRLIIANYKNISCVELDFSPGINCFTGKNGAGKTNLLDAVYYLSFCKSYFNTADNRIVRHGEDFFTIHGNYQRNEIEENIYAGFKINQKKQFKRNKKEYTKLSEHIGLLPIVLISPADERLIIETSDVRRRFIDAIISQFDKSYLEYLINYNRALMQRNTLLKNWKNIHNHNISQIELWDNQLFINGKVIFDKRIDFIKKIIPIFQKYYTQLSGKQESVNLIYNSHFENENYKKMMEESREKDIILGYTTRGIHRDDIEMLLNNFPVKQDGSQGQKKSFLIALKLAQYDVLYSCNKFSPILLLDDIFDKLDSERSANLINLVEQQYFRQILITDTQKDRLYDMIKKTNKNYSFFEANKGILQHEK